MVRTRTLIDGPADGARALWCTFTRCKFVESVGDFVFFKDMRGEFMRAFADSISDEGAEGQKGDGGPNRAGGGHTR